MKGRPLPRIHYNPHVVGQGRRHLVQPERGEVRLRPDRGAALRDGAHHAPPSECVPEPGVDAAPGGRRVRRAGRGLVE